MKNVKSQMSNEFLLTPHSQYSELILVLVFVVVSLFDNVQFDGIEADDFQLNSTLFTVNYLAFVRVGIDVHVSFAFGTCSGRHFSYLQRRFGLLAAWLLTLPSALNTYGVNLTAAPPIFNSFLPAK